MAQQNAEEGAMAQEVVRQEAEGQEADKAEVCILFSVSCLGQHQKVSGRVRTVRCFEMRYHTGL